VSHDTDKLIRQLSLVAFLMAERRPLTARDVKSNVEGYSEMSDEAFARRYYSDRAELIALGVPLQSQRDEFTGEELYTLRSDQYFLPPLELTDEELAALQTSLYLLEGKFAYAEPLRLALQNLALGRPGLTDEAPTQTAVRVEVLDPDYSAEMPGRLAKLEGAISKQRTIKFEYESIASGDRVERTLNPYALYNDGGRWYVVGKDLDRDDLRTFRVSRIRGEIRFATRRERDFRTPQDFDVEQFRGRPPWQIGELKGEARVEVRGDTAWWVQRSFGRTGRVEDGVFVTEYASLPMLASWVLRQDGRAVPLEPAGLKREVARALKAIREAHDGAPPALAVEQPETVLDAAIERPAGPVTPERFGILQSLLAYLLDACGERKSADISAAELLDRFPTIPAEELEEHLSLLNLVNFGGGCYTVYAELNDEGRIHVDKELYGETFRAAPRLTPLEARAIRLALEYVGPMIAAEAHTPLDRVRRKLEETFGQFELAQTPEPRVGTEEEELVLVFSEAIRKRRLVEIEYQKEGEETWSQRVVEPYSLERELPNWRVHTWDRTRDGERSFRLDRMRSATLTKDRFEPREGFEPSRLRGARTATVLYAPAVARWAQERGARPLEDGTALAELHVGSAEWLESEIFSFRGEAVVVEPEDLRERVAARAKELAQELGVARLRVPAART
jgi:predicted DNA-binding transcriptional regulator YafY